MRKIYVENDVLKNLFVKKTCEKGIITKRILGITLEYVHGSIYLPYISVLKYIKSYLNYSVDAMLFDFEKKSKLKHISSETYKKDLKDYLKIINNFNPSILKASSGELRKIQLKELEFAKKLFKI